MANVTLNKLKKSKKYLYFNAQKVRRNLSSISIGIKKHSKELEQLRKKINSDYKIPDNITIKLPSYKIYSNIIKDVEAFYKLLDKINYGKINISYYKTIENYIISDFTINDINKIYNDLIKYIKNTISKEPMKFIGIDIKFFDIGNNIEDFRINHKNPDWRVHLKSSKFKTLGYPDTSTVLDNIDDTLKLNKNISNLQKAYINTNLLEKKFYKLSNKIEQLYTDKKDEKYLYAISCLLSIYYLLEISMYKTYIWYNILLKYSILLLKHMKKED